MNRRVAGLDDSVFVDVRSTQFRTVRERHLNKCNKLPYLCNKRLDPKFTVKAFKIQRFIVRTLMPVTRSATRQSQRDNQVNAPRPASSTSASKTKTARKPRKKADAAQETEAAKTKRATNAVEHPAQLKSNSTSTANIPTTQSSFLPAVLTFPFDEAKLHLIKVDPRFEDIFSKLKCRPFENLERVDPFR